MPLNEASIPDRPASPAISAEGLVPSLPWEVLQAAYAYDAASAPSVTEELRDDPEYRLARLTFGKPGGESHTGLMLRPRAPARYPCVLLLHALSRDKEAMIRLFGRAFAQRGLASLA